MEFNDRGEKVTNKQRHRKYMYFLTIHFSVSNGTNRFYVLHSKFLGHLAEVTGLKESTTKKGEKKRKYTKFSLNLSTF